MWLNPAGKEMSDDEWNTGYARSIGLLLSGQTMDVRDSRGRADHGRYFVLFFNAHHDKLPFRLPRIRTSRAGWELVLDTARESGFSRKEFTILLPELSSWLSARWLFSGMD